MFIMSSVYNKTGKFEIMFNISEISDILGATDTGNMLLALFILSLKVCFYIPFNSEGHTRAGS